VVDVASLVLNDVVAVFRAAIVALVAVGIGKATDVAVLGVAVILLNVVVVKVGLVVELVVFDDVIVVVTGGCGHPL